MSNLDILIPFSLPPSEMAPDLLRELKIPAFATLLARGKTQRDATFDAFSRALPHEIWLARRFGLEARLAIGGSPPVALAAMQAHGLGAAPGVWFLLQPAHLHIARDHLVLTDQRQLALPEHESRALFDAAKFLFDEFDKPLLYGDANTWFIRADLWHALQTSTMDAACGHNIDIWMPKGEGERDWRKLQNEIQMLWHTHPVNEAREARGLKPVNSAWLWGGTPATMEAARREYTESFNLPGWSNALGQFVTSQFHASAVADVLAAKPQKGLLVLDSLIEPALASDWSTWLDRLHVLENHWFSPLLAALGDSRIDSLSLILSHGTQVVESTAGKHTLRKFWVKPSLAKLLP
ncbi:MAG: hypothetical protein V4632_13620 [Pseudomonadota bacterium]